jgi:hypothetical protein
MNSFFSRKGAKAQRKPFGNAAALCAFAPLRETMFCVKVAFVARASLRLINSGIKLPKMV